MLKKAIGSFFIISFFLLFVLSFAGTAQLWKKTVTPTEWWNEKIDIHGVYMQKNSQFLDKNGEVFEEAYLTERRKYLPYKDIPIDVIHAFISVEDQSFFEHRGVDIRGIGRALLTNIENQSIQQGGSTITQQLARNLYLSNEKNYE